MRDDKKYNSATGVKLDATTPKPPAHIKADPATMATWREVVGMLGDQGNLIKTDALAIEVAATVLATYRRIDAELKQLNGLTYYNARNEVKTHPLVADKATYATKLGKALNDLRLTPVTRSKATAPTYDPAEESEWTV